MQNREIGTQVALTLFLSALLRHFCFVSVNHNRAAACVKSIPDNSGGENPRIPTLLPATSRQARFDQESHMRAGPVRQLLRPGRLGVGEVRGAEHADENLRLADFARRRIDDADPLARIVDERLARRCFKWVN